MHGGGGVSQAKQKMRGYGQRLGRGWGLGRGVGRRPRCGGGGGRGGEWAADGERRWRDGVRLTGGRAGEGRGCCSG